jgi:hypothetical protein
MRWRIVLFGTLGALATVLGAVAVIAPRLVAPSGPLGAIVRPLTGADPKAVMTAAAAVVGLYVLVAARSRSAVDEMDGISDAERRFDAARTDPPEAVTADRRTMTGAGIDADVSLAVTGGGRPLRSIRDLLRDLAAETYAREEGVADEAALQAVERGAWTDNQVAAAFLASDDGPTASVPSRIRLWLAPDRERRRRIDATLDEIEHRRRER